MPLNSVQWILGFLFWVSALLLLYTYFGYPVLLGILARLAPRKPNLSASVELPAVTLLISAYNERPVITAKIENSLALDYPQDRLQIMVISDCSDDGTDAEVLRFAQSSVHLLRQSERRGKSAGLNLGVAQASGHVLVFSDANAMYDCAAIRKLVTHFSDPSVGYAVGHARYVERASDTQAGEAEGLYWKLETWLKRQESRFYSVVGGDGAIYAIRRELYTPLLPTDINDFLNPLQIIQQGYYGVFESGAVSYEEAAGSFAGEFRRRVRIISRSLNAALRAGDLLNPFRHPRHWFLLVSHKLLRWLAPFFMIVALATSSLLWQSPIFRALILLQAIFYAMAFAGWILQERKENWRLFSVAFYLCLVNMASLIACFKCLRGDLSGTWIPPRHKAISKAQ
jgi:cellulose synthase/poly-beta-1,6-N-acetylglucosamine synthase-like glycosyltransferase